MSFMPFSEWKRKIKITFNYSFFVLLKLHSFTLSGNCIYKYIECLRKCKKSLFRESFKLMLPHQLKYEKKKFLFCSRDNKGVPLYCSRIKRAGTIKGCQFSYPLYCSRTKRAGTIKSGTVMKKMLLLGI